MAVEIIERDIVSLKVEKDLINKAVKVKKEEIEDDLIKLSKQAKDTLTVDIKIDEEIENLEQDLRKSNRTTKLLIGDSPIAIYYHKLPFAVVKKPTDKKKFAELVNEKLEKGMVTIEDLIYKRKPLPKKQLEAEAQKQNINLEEYFYKRNKDVLALNPKIDKGEIIEVEKEKVNEIIDLLQNHSGNKIDDTLLIIEILKQREKDVERMLLEEEKQLLKLITENEELKYELSYLRHYKRTSYIPKANKLLEIPDYLFTEELDVKATLMNIRNKLTEDEKRYITPDEYSVYIFMNLQNAIKYSEKMANTYNIVSYPTVSKVNINANLPTNTNTKDTKTP